MADWQAVLVKFDPELLAAIDRVRASVPRTVWIKRLCSDAVCAHDMTAGYREGPLTHVEEQK